MPFKRKQRGKSKFNPSRKWKNAVKRVVSSQSETKKLGTEVSETSVSSAVAAVIFDDLSLVAQGDDDRQRIGDDIRAFGLKLQYYLINNSTNPSYCRVLLVQAENQEFDAITDLLLTDPDNEPAAPSAGSILDIHRDVNKRQVKVLYERIHKLNATDQGLGNISVRVNKLIKFNHNVKFTSGTAGTESENHNLRLWCINRGMNQDAETVICECTLDTKYYYKDM